MTRGDRSRTSQIEGSIIAHQQVEIETLRERIAQLETAIEKAASAPGIDWLSEQLELGKVLGERGCSPNPMEQYVEREFQKNLELAREELAMTVPDDLPPGYDANISEKSAWNMAVEWTQQDMENWIGNHFSQEWAGKQDAINKAHYE